MKHNYYILHLTLSKTNSDQNLTDLYYHGVYYRQCMAFVDHTETNSHTNRLVIYIIE